MTTIVPDMAAPWTPHWYGYEVPGESNDFSNVPDVLIPESDPAIFTECWADPVHVHTTFVPASTVNVDGEKLLSAMVTVADGLVVGVARARVGGAVWLALAPEVPPHADSAIETPAATANVPAMRDLPHPTPL